MKTEAGVREHPARHILKTWPEPYAAMRDGIKTHEYRQDDRGYEVGDMLVLREWKPVENAGGGGVFTEAPELIRWVTYIGRGGFGIPDGYCVMSVSPLRPDLRIAALARGELPHCGHEAALAAARAELADAEARANGADQRANAYLRERDEARAELERFTSKYDVAVRNLVATSDAREKAEAEVARLHKLFDDAGQGEHNVLALVDHHQDSALAAEAEARRLTAEAADLARQRDECAAEAQRLREAAELLSRVGNRIVLTVPESSNPHHHELQRAVGLALVPLDHHQDSALAAEAEARRLTAERDLAASHHERLGAELLQAEAQVADLTRQREECAAEALRLREALTGLLPLVGEMLAGLHPAAGAARDALAAPSPAAEALAEVRAEARREALDDVLDRLRCIRDNNEHHVCSCSCAAVRRLATAPEAPKPAGAVCDPKTLLCDGCSGECLPGDCARKERP